MPERSLAEVDAQWMQRVYAVNAMGPVLSTQALRTQLRKGAVVGSVSARVGSIGDNRSRATHLFGHAWVPREGRAHAQTRPTLMRCR